MAQLCREQKQLLLLVVVVQPEPQRARHASGRAFHAFRRSDGFVQRVVQEILPVGARRPLPPAFRLFSASEPRRRVLLVARRRVERARAQPEGKGRMRGRVTSEKNYSGAV